MELMDIPVGNFAAGISDEGSVTKLDASELALAVI